MGKADVNVNIWLSEKKRFANLFNGVISGGRQVILPEDLVQVNSVSSVSVKNRAGKTKNMKRYRDIIPNLCFVIHSIVKHHLVRHRIMNLTL